MTGTSADSRSGRSTSFSKLSPTTIWGGLRRWRPAIVGNADRPELGEELTNSFCRTDPEIAKHFARVTFTSDNRSDLPKVAVPALILQSQEDIIAPLEVGQYVAANIPESRLVVLDATGHCANLSAPDQVIAAMRAFV